MSFLAQSLDEVHGDVAIVDVAVEIEDQHFEKRGLTADRRPCSDLRDAVEHASTEPAHARSEDAVDRRVQPLQIHVGRRETELLAEPESAHDAPRYRVVASEHAARRRKVAAVQRFANRRAADALSLPKNRRHFRHGEAVPIARVAQCLERAVPVGAEPEIVADDHGPALSPATRTSAMKVSEVNCLIAPKRGQKSSSMPSASSPSKRSRKLVSRAGGLVGAKNSFGVGSNENTSDRAAAAFASAFACDRIASMADVQAVEHTDRHGALRLLAAGAARTVFDRGAFVSRRGSHAQFAHAQPEQPADRKIHTAPPPHSSVSKTDPITLPSATNRRCVSCAMSSATAITMFAPTTCMNSRAIAGAADTHPFSANPRASTPALNRAEQAVAAAMPICAGAHAVRTSNTTNARSTSC